jgi:hypothetical protein
MLLSSTCRSASYINPQLWPVRVWCNANIEASMAQYDASYIPALVSITPITGVAIKH